MLSSNKIVTLNGRSNIEVSGTSKELMTMTASLNERNNISITLTALDGAAYIENSTAVNTDVNAFIAEFIQKVGSANATGSEA